MSDDSAGSVPSMLVRASVYKGHSKGAIPPQWCGTGGSSEPLAAYRLSPFGPQASDSPCETVPWPESAQACVSGMPSIPSSAIYPVQTTARTQNA